MVKAGSICGVKIWCHCFFLAFVLLHLGGCGMHHDGVCCWMSRHEMLIVGAVRLYNLGTGFVFKRTSMFVGLGVFVHIRFYSSPLSHSIWLLSNLLSLVWRFGLHVLPFFLISPLLGSSASFVYLFHDVLPAQFGSTSTNTLIPACATVRTWHMDCHVTIIIGQ